MIDIEQNILELDQKVIDGEHKAQNATTIKTGIHGLEHVEHETNLNYYVMSNLNYYLNYYVCR